MSDDKDYVPPEPINDDNDVPDYHGENDDYMMPEGDYYEDPDEVAELGNDGNMDVDW